MIHKKASIGAALAALFAFWVSPLAYSESYEPVKRIHDFRVEIPLGNRAAGFGLGFLYGWAINPRFTVGIDSRIRRLGDSTHLVYGLKLSHRVWISGNEGSTPFRPSFWCFYGLLMRMSFQDSRPGYAHSHETELGIDFKFAETAGIRWGFLGSLSYSKLRFFETQEGARSVVNTGVSMAF